MKQSTLPMLVTAMLATGCVPYLVHKTLQPAAKATIRDEQGKPILGANVTLVASAYPYRREKSRETQVTGADGLSQFPARREWRTEVLAMHGWEEFYWNWCVQKEGFETYSTLYRSASEFQAEAIFVLKPGQSSPCPQGIR